MTSHLSVCVCVQEAAVSRHKPTHTSRSPEAESYLCRLGDGLVQGGGATLDLLLDGQVAFLGLSVALPHRRPLLGAQLGHLGADLQQLVYVGLVLRYGLSQELGREGLRKLVKGGGGEGGKGEKRIHSRTRLKI